MKKTLLFIITAMLSLGASAQNSNAHMDGYLDLGNMVEVLNSLKGIEADFKANHGENAYFYDESTGQLTLPVYVLTHYKTYFDWVDDATNLTEYNRNNDSQMWLADKAYNGIDFQNYFKGKDYYFGNKTVYYSGIATNSLRYLNFYVKNCDNVSIYCYNPASDHNKCTLRIFENLGTESNPRFNSAEQIATTGRNPTYGESGNPGRVLVTTTTTTNPSARLDPTKVYMIEISCTVSDLFEISFGPGEGMVYDNLRTFDLTSKPGSNNLATMYIDFPVSIPMNLYPDDLKHVWYATGVEGGQLILEPLSLNNDGDDYIPAETAVIVNSTIGKTITFTETRHDVSVIDNVIKNGDESKGPNILLGTLKDVSTKTAKGDHANLLTLGRKKGDETNVGFFVYTGAKVGKNRAYMVTDDPQAKFFSIFSDETVTRIEAAETEVNTDATWYTLQGIRMNARPTQSGIYITNGRKVLVK